VNVEKSENWTHLQYQEVMLMNPPLMR